VVCAESIHELLLGNCVECRMSGSISIPPIRC
jgi:hypothetical protein